MSGINIIDDVVQAIEGIIHGTGDRPLVGSDISPRFAIRTAIAEDRFQDGPRMERFDTCMIGPPECSKHFRIAHSGAKT